MTSTVNIFNEIEQTISEVIDMASLFTEDEINITPFEGCWTPGEVIEHIIITLSGYITQLNGPVTDTDRVFDDKVAMLKKIFLDFGVKYNAPKSAVPERKNYNKEELLAKLKAADDRLNLYDRSADMTLTCVAFEYGGNFGYMTRIENLHFLLYHTQRHLHQLKNMYNIIHQSK